MELNDFLAYLEEQVRSDGVENTLRMIKSQNIQGPSASEFFGEEFGAYLARQIAEEQADDESILLIACGDEQVSTVQVYSLVDYEREHVKDYKPANDDTNQMALAA